MCGDRAWAWGNNSGCSSALEAVTKSHRGGGGQGEARLCSGGQNPTAGPGGHPSYSSLGPGCPRPWPHPSSLCVHPHSASFPPSKATSVSGSGPILMTPLSLITSAKGLLPQQACSQAPGARAWTRHFGGRVTSGDTVVGPWRPAGALPTPASPACVHRWPLSKNQRAGLALRTEGVALLSQRAHPGWALPRAPPRGRRWTGRPRSRSFPGRTRWGRASRVCWDLGSHRLCSFCGHRGAGAGGPRSPHWVCRGGRWRQQVAGGRAGHGRGLGAGWPVCSGSRRRGGVCRQAG